MATTVLPPTRRDLRDAPFLAAAAGRRPSRIPIWLMRQAGRSLPEYRALRADTGMLQACVTPELICEITMQPVRRHGVDAAILFSDIVVPLHAGREASGIACRSFRATVAALALLMGSAGVDDLRAAVDGLAKRIAMPAAADLDAVAADLDGASSIDVVAPPGLLGLAEQAALMLREAPRLPAHAWETADWLHVAVYLALPGHRAVLVPGSPTDDEVAATVERRGGGVHRLDTGDRAAGPIERTILGSLAAERLAVASWRRAKANDKEP